MDAFLKVRSVRDNRILMSQLSTGCFLNCLSNIKVLNMRTDSRYVNFANFRRRRARMITFRRLIIHLFRNVAFAYLLLYRGLNMTFTAFNFAIITRISSFGAFRARIGFFNRFLGTFVIARRSKVTSTFDLNFSNYLRRI